MIKKIIVIGLAVLFGIYVIFQFDIKPIRTGKILDDKNNPINGIDIIYVVMDMYPTPGGPVGDNSICYHLKTDKSGLFILPKTTRWSLYPLFFSEAYLYIIGGKNYGTKFILPENKFSEYVFEDGGFNKPIVLIKATNTENQIKNLEDLADFQKDINISGIYDFCDKETIKNY